MSEQELRTQLYASFRHRALIYYLIFDELRQELDEERAIAIMKRAIRRRGEAVGEQFAELAPNQLDGLKDAFLAVIPDDGQMFAPEVTECNSGQLDITFHQCPLKDAWRDAGLPDRDVATLCEIAAEIDVGTFVGAGFKFEATTWKPDCEDCCHLHIRPGSNGE